MKKVSYKVFGILLILMVSAGSVAFYMYNKPALNVLKSKPEFSVNARLLINEFETFEPTANKKYLEKIVEVNGTVLETSLEQGKGIVTLDGGEAMGTVICHVSAEENKKIEGLKEGTSVAIKGICTGYLLDVLLVKCYINN